MQARFDLLEGGHDVRADPGDAPAGAQPLRFQRFLRGDPDAIETEEDLARLGDLVTTQRASVFTERLVAAGVRIDDATDDNRVNLRKILAGHGRFAYINDLTVRYLIRKEGLEDRVRVLPVVLGNEPTYFWISRRADPALAPLLGATLGKLRASGELDRIYARWADMP
jgi:glutamate/aspartate transport system substrate-binding protein